MIAGLQEAVFLTFLVFCRLGGCVMLAPGFSSSRVPMQVRLLIAVGVALAVAPMTAPSIGPSLSSLEGTPLLQITFTELLTGIILGLMGRCFLLAAQFAATFIANVIGLAGIPGIPIEDSEGSAPLASLMSMSATMILLAAGAHIELLRAVVESYDAIPVRLSFDADFLARNLIAVLSETSFLALRLAAPFAAYSILVNFAIGLAGKFTPQLQLYFISTGAILVGGFLILLLVTPDWLGLLSGAYWSWLNEGHLE